MPLISKFNEDKNVEIVLWKIDENANYFHDKLTIHPTEENILNTLSNKKLLEWLSSRYVLHLMSGRKVRGEFTKDIHGKPHLKDSTFAISISHSSDIVAVAASEQTIGVDIQHYVTKIHRIAHKFVNDGEMDNVPKDKTLEGLHVIWGAKESLYKAYGKRSLDFKKHIQISDLDLSSDAGKFSGRVSKEDYQKEFEMHFKLFEKFTLVYAKECH